VDDPDGAGDAQIFAQVQLVLSAPQSTHRGRVKVGGVCLPSQLERTVHNNFLRDGRYSGRGKFMPMPLKNKILETPGSLVTDDIKMFPL
jgi:hypothetical protein